MPKPPGPAAAADESPAPMEKAARPLSEMLVRWKAGDQCALDELMPVVYDELRRAARRRLRRERPGHSFQSAALVNEMYMRMIGQKPFGTENRLHFFMVASRLMRQILVDHARSHGAAKRGAEHNCRLDTSIVLPEKQSIDVIAVNDALTSLSSFDKQQADIVELRFFGGLAMEEVAESLSISLSTAKRDWNVAKAWLARELNRGSHDHHQPVATD